MVPAVRHSIYVYCFITVRGINMLIFKVLTIAVFWDMTAYTLIADYAKSQKTVVLDITVPAFDLMLKNISLL